MKKSVFIFSGISFLMISLLIGNPVEFLDKKADIIATFITMLFFFLLFALLFHQNRKTEQKRTKSIANFFLIIIAVIYFPIGFWTILTVNPKWQDISIYTNDEGQKVISQWRETSGSIYDYRAKRIIFETNKFRFHINCNLDNLKGDWKEYNLKTKTVSIVNFEN